MNLFTRILILILCFIVSLFVIAWTFNHINPYLAGVGGFGIAILLYYLTINILKLKQKK